MPKCSWPCFCDGSNHDSMVAITISALLVALRAPHPMVLCRTEQTLPLGSTFNVGLTDPEDRSPPLWCRSCPCISGAISTLDSERKQVTISNFCSRIHFSHLFFHSWLGPHSVYFSLLVLWLSSFIGYNLRGSVKSFVLTQWHYLVSSFILH